MFESRVTDRDSRSCSSPHSDCVWLQSPSIKGIHLVTEDSHLVWVSVEVGIDRRVTTEIALQNYAGFVMLNGAEPSAAASNKLIAA